MERDARSELSILEALRVGWDRAQNNPRIVLAFGSLGLLLAIFRQRASLSSDATEGHPLLALAVELAQFFLNFLLARVALQLVDAQPLRFAPLARTVNEFLGFLLTTIVYLLVVAAGLALLVFPGLIWAPKFVCAPMLVLDQRLDPLAAMYESARLTEHCKARVLGFMAVLFVVNLLGAMAFGIGLILSVPLTMVAAAHGLRQLQVRAGTPSGSSVPSRHQTVSA